MVKNLSEIILWLAIVIIVYPYIIYPLAIYLIGKARPRYITRGLELPSITILIPAYNEANCIRATIKNKLDQGYPSDKLQVIVISDGSTDATDDIVEEFSSAGVILLRREGRAGKAAALNAAAKLATGEILVFSDANSLFGPSTLQKLVANFADPQVGYVTGALEFLHSDESFSGNGVSAYMRFENFLREIETKSGSIVGVNGGVDAIRTCLYIDTPDNLITDFILPMTVIARDMRVIYDASATAFEVPNSAIGSEFRMRVRVALRAMQGLLHMRSLLNPIRHPIESFCLISHKIIRYMGFFFMALAIFFNFALAVDSVFYQFLLGMQIGMYILALLGMTPYVPTSMKSWTVVPSYLVLSNAAFAVAAFRFLRGDSIATWQPRVG